MCSSLVLPLLLQLHRSMKLKMVCPHPHLRQLLRSKDAVLLAVVRLRLQLMKAFSGCDKIHSDNDQRNGMREACY